MLNVKPLNHNCCMYNFGGVFGSFDLCVCTLLILFLIWYFIFPIEKCFLLGFYYSFVIFFFVAGRLCHGHLPWCIRAFLHGVEYSRNEAALGCLVKKWRLRRPDYAL
jgi:hypothetical protein